MEHFPLCLSTRLHVPSSHGLFRRSYQEGGSYKVDLCLLSISAYELESSNSDDAILVFFPFVEHLWFKYMYFDEQTKNKKQIQKIYR